MFSEKADFDRSLYEHRRPLAGSGSGKLGNSFSAAINHAKFDNFINASSVGHEYEGTPPFTLTLTL